MSIHAPSGNSDIIRKYTIPQIPGEYFRGLEKGERVVLRLKFEEDKIVVKKMGSRKDTPELDLYVKFGLYKDAIYDEARNVSSVISMGELITNRDFNAILRNSGVIDEKILLELASNTDNRIVLNFKKNESGQIGVTLYWYDGNSKIKNKVTPLSEVTGTLGSDVITTTTDATKQVLENPQGTTPDTTLDIDLSMPTSLTNSNPRRTRQESVDLGNGFRIM